MSQSYIEHQARYQKESTTNKLYIVDTGSESQQIANVGVQDGKINLYE